MNIRTITFAVSAVALATAMTTSAQVIIRGTESSDGSTTTTTSTVTISTPDRDIVPIIKDTKDAKVNDTTEQSESVLRRRLNDGSYVESQRTTTVKKDLSPENAVSSTDVVEKDRQGQNHVSSHTVQTVSKSATGETEQSKVRAEFALYP